MAFRRGHRKGSKWKRTEKESGWKGRSGKGIRPKIYLRLVSVYLNFRSGNGPKNIFQSVSYFLRLDSVLLLGWFTVSFGPILIILILVYSFSSVQLLNFSVRFTTSFCLFPHFFCQFPHFFCTFLLFSARFLIFFCLLQHYFCLFSHFFCPFPYLFCQFPPFFPVSTLFCPIPHIFCRFYIFLPISSFLLPVSSFFSARFFVFLLNIQSSLFLFL